MSSIKHLKFNKVLANEYGVFKTHLPYEFSLGSDKENKIYSKLVSLYGEKKCTVYDHLKREKKRVSWVEKITEKEANEMVKNYKIAQKKMSDLLPKKEEEKTKRGRPAKAE